MGWLCGFFSSFLQWQFSFSRRQSRALKRRKLTTCRRPIPTGRLSRRRFPLFRPLGQLWLSFTRELNTL
jgi:hypothetical protein